jgi:hypothetical protein
VGVGNKGDVVVKLACEIKVFISENQGGKQKTHTVVDGND